MIILAVATITANYFGHPAQAATSILYQHEPDPKELMCVSKNIFFEARGQSTAEKIRIFNVTHNRVANPKFPKTYCGVVKQHKQFSWVGNVKPLEFYIKNDAENDAWMESVAIARLGLAGVLQDKTNGALFYHTIKIKKPCWAKNLHMLFASETHFYYKYKDDKR